MSPPDDGGQRYYVHLATAIAQRLRQIQRQATREGRGEAVLAAFREIIDRLSRAPADFGEPLYRLPVLRMQVRHGAILPLFIDFAVCEDLPLVFIRGIRLLTQLAP
jgi:hypothetical protein